MRYIKEVFDVQTLPQAMNVVLTADQTRPDKFHEETEFLVDVIADNVDINKNHRILDFGCGMGRMSRAIIERFGCSVTGVDISDSMLKFAQLWVRNPRLFSVQMDFPADGSIDFVLSAFVLQHAKDPAGEIDRIYDCLKPSGVFILVNENIRFVPGDVDKNNFIVWHDDGVDVHDLTEKKFKKVKTIPYLDTEVRIEFYEKES